MTIPWWAAATVANVAIITSEYIHRSVPAGTSWSKIMPWALPVYIVGQFFLFKCFSGAPHWLTAWMVFTVGNSIMRVAAVSTWAPGEVDDWRRVVIGTAGMILCAFYVKGGLK